jgi:hypothetical protein
VDFRRRDPLPADAVEQLFSALTLRYGMPFLDRWRDIDINVVKADWARELSGFKPAAVRFALDNLPEKPPTVIDFRRLANQAPPPPASDALPYNRGATRGPTPAEREQMRALARDIRAGTFFAKPSREWAYDLIRCDEEGWKDGNVFRSTPVALEMARDAIATDPDRWERAPLQRRQPARATEEEPF